ncbi:IclR family transcriptional regulator [Microbacterium sp. p3-SID338]|uniref:IclR family transcriptional regulator n=1 Tax=unclassified Microbacterium TaxID=2609290 RepID=UPI000C80A900|nr:MULTISPECIES: IclR family transcriptional regulator [unclassified Microbacterium]MCT1396446.1 IclR family transcriptional regulator [Microbacterium sp. p3-SID338]PMC06844.1 IclR family transcriptional regulator [Microbacterium sp. UMB0228]
MNAAEAEPTLIGSVQRALRLVDIVANSPRPLPAKMLSSITGLTPGTTYNLVRTLVHEGYLSTEPDGLVLGNRFPSFQQQIGSRGVFLARVRAALRAVTEDVGATAYLSRYADGEIHLVDIVDAVRNPRIELWVGLHASAHATALGKQILAALSEEDRLDYLARHRLEELTPRTISDRTALLTQLEQTPGWAIDREEYAIGATCVAVPVIAPGVTASLAVSLPADQAVVNRRLVSNLQRAARRLSVQLGADALDTDGPDAEFTI